MQQITFEGYACKDCMIAIANNDYSGMDSEVCRSVDKSIRYLEQKYGYPIIGDNLGFMHCGCDCCGSKLHGDKYELRTLGEIK